MACALVQDGDDAGVGLCADGPSKALTQLNLHLRHGHILNKLAKGCVFLPLFFLQCVRIGERQAGDHQQGYAVAGEIKAFPCSACSQQHSPRRLPKPLRHVHGVSAQGKHRKTKFPLPQPILYR